MFQRCVRREQDCEVESGCPGVQDPGVCNRVAALAAWRAKSRDEQTAYFVELGKTLVPTDPSNPTDPSVPVGP